MARRRSGLFSSLFLHLPSHFALQPNPSEQRLPSTSSFTRLGHYFTRFRTSIFTLPFDTCIRFFVISSLAELYSSSYTNVASIPEIPLFAHRPHRPAPQPSLKGSDTWPWCYEQAREILVEVQGLELSTRA